MEKKSFLKIIQGFFVYLAGIFFLMPVIWIFSVSLRSKRDVFSTMFFVKEVHFENYALAWETFKFGAIFMNTIFVTLSSTLLTLLISSLAAYSFSKIQYKGSNIVFYLILLGIMIPPASVVVPLFLMMKFMGLYNSLLSLVIAYIAFGLPIAVLILRGFFISIPKELIEAARIDGSTEIYTFFRIILPLARPALATVTIFLFMQNWNEFIIALVLLRDRANYTLPVGLANFVGQYTSPWQLVAAAVIISSIPIFAIYLLLQDQFVKGLTAGAVKS